MHSGQFPEALTELLFNCYFINSLLRRVRDWWPSLAPGATSLQRLFRERSGSPDPWGPWPVQHWPAASSRGSCGSCKPNPQLWDGRGCSTGHPSYMHVVHALIFNMHMHVLMHKQSWKHMHTCTHVHTLTHGHKLRYICAHMCTYTGACTATHSSP